MRSISLDDPDKRPGVLEVPVLPKLRVFQILRSPSKSGHDQLITCPHAERRVPGLELKFVTATPDQGIVINYAVQFPSLRRLEVGTEAKSLSSEGFWFESCITFLFGSFLPPPSHEQRPCTSLRLFIIDTRPQRKLEKFKRQNCDQCCTFQSRRTRISSSLELRSQFYRRVGDTFPNIRNVARYREAGFGDALNLGKVEHEDKMRN